MNQGHNLLPEEGSFLKQKKTIPPSAVRRDGNENPQMGAKRSIKLIN
jgi:hypothetical protein